MECERQQSCSFFSEFKENAGRKQYQLFIRSYCFGPLKDQCKRLAYEQLHGMTPPANLCPNGYRYRSFPTRPTSSDGQS